MTFDRNAVEDAAFGHKPVLLDECLEALAIKPDGIYVDGTLGRAGHSLEICRRLTTGRLIAIDRDESSIARAKELAGTNAKMFCTATEVGIPDPNYFGRCFKKYTGKSYSEYAKSRTK